MGESGPKNEIILANLLNVCQRTFTLAYSKHADSNQEGYVVKAGKAELVWLQDPSESYGIILARPDLSTSDTSDISFWVSRINVHMNQRQHFEDLVAIPTDSSRFYIKDGEAAIPRPFGLEESQEIAAYIASARIVPALSADVYP